jgi:membrane peptidoglycan carboxypeptidase
MNNNPWNGQQQNGHQSPERRPGSLLRDYRQQHPSQSGVQQMSPTNQSPLPPQYSPLPPTPAQYSPGQPAQQQLPAQWPSPHGGQPPRLPAGPQGWMANTVQRVRQWSGRMRAVPQVDQNPLILYRPTTPAPLPKSQPWQRSRSTRIAMMMRHRRKRWRDKRPKTGKIWSIITIVTLLVIAISASATTAYAYNYYQSQLPRLQGLANQQVEQTTRIYDRSGSLLYEVYDNQSASGGRRTPVSYQYIPQAMDDAMIAAEDHTFWTNSGIDPQGILRAAVADSNGTIQGGGSTITQQLIKNLTGDTQDTLARKIPEAALAIGLTQQYPKWKILEMYFNISPFGAQDLGVEAAAEDYFGLMPQCSKDFNCTPGIYYLNCETGHQQQCDPANCATSKYCNPLLGLARASLLAGLPQNPVIFDPTLGYVDTTASPPIKYYLERQEYVLQQMVQLQMSEPGLGTITPAIANAALNLTANTTFTPYQHVYYHGDQHFVNWVIAELEQQMGVETFLTGGFNIYTTIDTNLEHYVEAAVHRHLYEPEYQPFQYDTVTISSNNNVNDAAVVVEDAKTGEILAMDGSSNYNSTNPEVSGNINMATSPRQPGSTMKSIVYTAAFQEGWYPGMILPDKPTDFPTGTAPVVPNCNVSAYCPSDYNGDFANANVTIRNATADSRNIPAIRSSLVAGLPNVIALAQRMGITTLNAQQDSNLSLAIGTSAIPLYQMVGAYQTFADNGVHVQPHYVLDIWDNYGHHLYHFDPTHPGGVQVITPQIAFLMTSVLSDEYARQAEFWPDHELSFWNPPDSYSAQPDPLYPDVAAKTGTTDDFKDNLTIGYTSKIVVGVWAGNANDQAMNDVIGITGAAPIWHSVMTYISGMCDESFDSIPCGHPDLDYPPTTFTAPPGVVKVCVNPQNGLLAPGGFSADCDYMLQNEVPQQTGYMQGNPNPTPTPTPGG